MYRVELRTSTCFVSLCPSIPIDINAIRMNPHTPVSVLSRGVIKGHNLEALRYASFGRSLGWYWVFIAANNISLTKLLSNSLSTASMCSVTSAKTLIKNTTCSSSYCSDSMASGNSERRKSLFGLVYFTGIRSFAGRLPEIIRFSESLKNG